MRAAWLQATADVNACCGAPGKAAVCPLESYAPKHGERITTAALGTHMSFWAEKASLLQITAYHQEKPCCLLRELTHQALLAIA